jgi:hypothetical protein
MILGAAVISVLAQAGMAASPAGQFKISALKKTVAKDQSATQELPRGTTRMEEKKIVYQFEVQNQSTEYSQQDLKVRWVVMMEGAEGRSYQDAPGDKTTVLPFGRAVTLETAPITVAERTWRGMAGRTAEMSQVIEGYGLQILTLDGQVVAEKYEPESLKSEIQWEAPLPPAGFDRGARSPWPRRPVPLRPNPIPTPAP